MGHHWSQAPQSSYSSKKNSSLLTATRESLNTAKKTQHSQNLIFFFFKEKCSRGHSKCKDPEAWLTGKAGWVHTSGMKSWMANSDWVYLEYNLRLYFRQATCWSFWCSDQIWGTKVLRVRSSLHSSFNPPIPALSLLLTLLVLPNWHLLTFECLFSV